MACWNSRSAGSWRRICCIGAASAALWAGSATAARYSVMLHAPMPMLDASRPAPAGGTPGYVPAPTPDVDAAPPTVRLGDGQPQWGASLQGRRGHALRPGAGTTSGADFSENLQRRRGASEEMSPTLNLRMPLQ